MSTRTKGQSNSHQNLNSWQTILLWVAAGGRCERCRKLLTESDTSYRQLNLAERAHIVGQGGAKSPRHDAQLSPVLATSRDNIMLLCFDCHAEIDDSKTRDQFPADALRDMKALHEERIKYLTSLDAKRTRVIAFQTAIQQSRDGEASLQQQTTLHKGDLHDAILPDYFPDRSKPSFIEVDLPTEEDPAHWEQLKKTIKAKWDKQDVEGVEHLSVFCLGKIPAIVLFGRLVGNTRKVTAMNVQQGVATRWKHREQVPETFAYQVTYPEESEGAKKDVVLLVSLSGLIELGQYNRATPSDAATYVISNQSAHRHVDWLVAEQQVIEFRTLYQRLLSEIQERHGQNATVHLLLAAPTPIVFEAGRQYRPNQHPPLRVYNCVNRRYEYALSLGE